MSVGGGHSTFDEPGVGVKWKMSEKVYGTRKVATKVMTIARTCETVAYPTENATDDGAKALLPVVLEVWSSAPNIALKES